MLEVLDSFHWGGAFNFARNSCPAGVKHYMPGSSVHLDKAGAGDAKLHLDVNQDEQFTEVALERVSNNIQYLHSIGGSGTPTHPLF